MRGATPNQKNEPIQARPWARRRTCLLCVLSGGAAIGAVACAPRLRTGPAVRFRRRGIMRRRVSDSRVIGLRQRALHAAGHSQHE